MVCYICHGIWVSRKTEWLFFLLNLPIAIPFVIHHTCHTWDTSLIKTILFCTTVGRRVTYGLNGVHVFTYCLVYFIACVCFLLDLWLILQLTFPKRMQTNSVAFLCLRFWVHPGPKPHLCMVVEKFFQQGTLFSEEGTRLKKPMIKRLRKTSALLYSFPRDFKAHWRPQKINRKYDYLTEMLNLFSS